MSGKKLCSKLDKLTLCIRVLFLSSWICFVMPENDTIPVNVGVLLDDLNSNTANIWLRCINRALSNFYATHAHYKTRLVLKIKDSKSDIVGAAAEALHLIQKEQVLAIIGPVTSLETSFVINLGQQAHVPIISFSATSPSLTSVRSTYFFQFAQNDSSQVKTISSIVKAFGWRQVVPIYIDNEYGHGIIPYLTDALQEVQAYVPYRSLISPYASDDQIENELHKLMTMQTRVFIVHMTTDLWSRLVYKAKAIGMMSEGYVWIMTTALTNSLNPMVSLHSMDGVLGVETYVPKTEQFQEFVTWWYRQFHEVALDVFGLWAYDAACALAMAVEPVIGTPYSFDTQESDAASINSAYITNIPVSKYGPELCKALSSIRFQGLAGNFSLVDGQLQSSTFQIVNVIGTGEKVVGYWTLQNGLVRHLNSTSTRSSSYSTSNTSLGSIIWPGDAVSAPKGWQIPTSGNKLKILVPVKSGFQEFLNVTFDPSTNTSTVNGGYTIDVFEAAIHALPYDLDYEFHAYAKPNGEKAGNYNDLVYQVFLGNYDVAIGDITIRANRSMYVDFSLPFTDSGVSTIVPITDNRSKAWLFLKPLTPELWATSACFFIFIGFVVWFLEHRINEEFRGPPLHEIGTSCGFAFSTMVFAHRERLVGILAKFVVILWCLVVLILTQSYTASLTSYLTVRRFQSTVIDINTLLKNGDNVGYNPASFIAGILKQQGFQDDKLKAYSTVDELNKLFDKGTANGGITAAFNEIPYIKLFLATYCSKYKMVEPAFKSDGFAFAFQKDSPLARDFSRAILQVNEGGQMKTIEDKWFGKQASCPDPSSNDISSISLGLECFWGLFLIVGIASSLALLISAVMFFYEHKDVDLSSESSVWRKILVISRMYDQKDLKCHTFNKTSAQVDNTNYPPSTSSYSNHTEVQNVAEEQRLSTELGDLSPNREIELVVHQPERV